MADKMKASENTTEDRIICYAPTMIITNGLWQGDNPLDYSLPLFILQLILVVVTIRLVVFLLKPFRQPRVVSEILGGVLLGPSVLGRSPAFANAIFPLRSVMVLETMANIGLLYFLFLVGLEMDLGVVWRTGKRSMTIATAGMILPFGIGVLASLVINNDMKQYSFTLFLGIALSVTAFPVLARVLAELKLVNTELGKAAMSAALVNDVFAWILLAVAIALTDGQSTSLHSLWVILLSVGFVLFSIFVVRPAISWMIRRTPEGEGFSDLHICIILTGVMVSGFVTDALGTHCVFGAFVFGLIIPNGPLGLTLTERLEDFISGLLLPLFFAISGLKTDIRVINGAFAWGMLFLIIVLALAGKVGGTLLVSLYYQMTMREGLTLGLLMNCKGLVEMIILNLGKDQKVIDDRSFTIMVITALIMTGIITPIVTVIYRPTRRFAPYKRRTIQRSKPDAELRVMICIHTPKNVPTITNLLEASHPTKKSPMFIYVLHLVELTGRASAMLIVHNTRKAGRPALNRTQAHSDSIINAFEHFEQHVGSVSVQPLTAISPYSTMHEDICNLAEDKRVTFIIVPFHKQQTVDGSMETPNPALQAVNQNVLANAPCSVGILVDRGLIGASHSSPNQISCQVAVLFFGGPDDREALSYAWRMSERPGIRLTVMRFVLGAEAINSVKHSEPLSSDGNTTSTVETGAERDKQLDEEIMREFMSKTANDESVVYIEKIVNNGEETVAAVRSMNNSHELFIVGRGEGTISPLTAGITDWSECPELGAIGDLLASSDLTSMVSVLVIQQYNGVESQDGLATPDSPDELPFQQTRRGQSGLIS